MEKKKKKKMMMMKKKKRKKKKKERCAISGRLAIIGRSVSHLGQSVGQALTKLVKPSKTS